MPVDLISRYRDLPVIETQDARRGVTRALPIRRPVPEQAAGGRLHQVNGYESPDLVALKHYNREQLYWVLLDYNNIDLPEELAIGQTIMIPPLNVVTQVKRSG